MQVGIEAGLGARRGERNPKQRGVVRLVAAEADERVRLDRVELPRAVGDLADVIVDDDGVPLLDVEELGAGRRAETGAAVGGEREPLEDQRSVARGVAELPPGERRELDAVREIRRKLRGR